jgi:ABC-2 type transport system ATP-binding protein
MIQVENLTKYFGPVLAVHNVSFQVERNEIVGLLGNNGAGKTTIMRMLTTYLPATSGIARVAGFDVMNQSMQVRQNIGYLPESIPLYPEMRVEEYLDFRAKLKGVDRRTRPAQVARSLERCRIREVQRRLLGTLSKGYRQRVGLADAMLHNPAILILDEPTDGLDPGQKAETLAMLKELGRDHTIMLSSHLLTEVEAMVQRVIILRRGHLGLAMKIADLQADPIIVLEIRGPGDQILGVLRSADGVSSVSSENLGDGLHAYQIRPARGQDLREMLAARVYKNGWSLRRLDLRRRNLQDRWNEINNAEEEAARAAPSLGGQAAPPAPVPNVAITK